MNKQRRKNLLDVAEHLQDALDRLSEIRDEEQDTFDNMPESLQYSSRGDAMQEAIDIMDEWESTIDVLKSSIEEFAGY